MSGFYHRRSFRKLKWTKVAVAICLVFILLSSLISTACAFSVNSLEIEVQKNGDAITSSKYSLSLWESFLLWIRGIFGEEGKQIEGIIENQLGREISSFKMEKDGTVSFIIDNYTGTVDREEGTWYWTKFYLSEDACKKINLGTVSVTFPDGFFYEFDRKLPNIKHLENEDFAELYLEARYRNEVYNRMAPLYFASTYQKEMSNIFSQAMMWEGFKIGIQVISAYIPAGKLVIVEEIMSMTASSKLSMEAESYAKQLAESQIRWIMLQPLNNAKLGVYMNDMSKLTEDESDLISSLVSNPEEYDKNLKRLKENYVKQKDKIKDLKEEADYCYQYYGITCGEYGKNLFEYARDLADVDSKHVDIAITIIEEK